MKKNKLLLLISILLVTIMSVTYAAWQAGGGVKWIGESETNARFTGPTVVSGTGAYTDTWTGYKWQVGNSTTTLQWSTDNSYPEPVWNGAEYIYDALRSEADYPAFAYCRSLGGLWRLPTKKEMYSIMTKVETNSQITDYYTKLESFFASFYWSSTSFAANTDNAWLGSFGAGTMSIISKTNYKQVLCIHD